MSGPSLAVTRPVTVSGGPAAGDGVGWSPDARPPVFVDPTGRRAPWLRRALGVVGAVAALYVATVVLSLFLPAGALHLSVPGLGPVLAGPAPAPVHVQGAHPRRLAALIPAAEPRDLSGDATSSTVEPPAGVSARSTRSGHTATPAPPTPAGSRSHAGSRTPHLTSPTSPRPRVGARSLHPTGLTAPRPAGQVLLPPAMGHSSIRPYGRLPALRPTR